MGQTANHHHIEFLQEYSRICVRFTDYSEGSADWTTGGARSARVQPVPSWPLGNAVLDCCAASRQLETTVVRRMSHMFRQTDGPIGRSIQWVTSIFAVLALQALLAFPAAADERDDEISRLKTRLDALEQRLNLPGQANAPEAVAGQAPTTDPAPANVSKAAQEPKDESKAFSVGSNLKVEGSWRNGLWFETADKAFRWNVGGVVQSDWSFFGANRDLVQSIGTFNNLVDPGTSLQDGMVFRRARLRFAGLMWEQVEFYAQYEFAQALDLRRRTLGINPVPTNPPNSDFDPGDDVGFNEVYLGLVDLPFLGTLRVGRHRESLNFVTATADNNQVWLERGLMFDAFNGDFNFSNGVTLQQTFLEDRVYGLLGFFHANNNTNRGFFAVGDGEYAYDGRLTCLPVYDEERQAWVHLGVDYSYRNPHQTQVRYRARPLVRSGPSFQTPNLLNTGTIFTPDAEQIANLEFAMAYGRFTFAAEAAASWVTSAYTGGLPRPDGTLPDGAQSRGTFLANGGYVEALYFLTPDHRKYVKDRPGYARVTPRSNFYLLDGEQGWVFSRGGWEVGLRYDFLDLTDSGINGGVGNAYSFCVNWYLNANARCQFNYSAVDRQFSPSDDEARREGYVHCLGIRFNIDF